MKKSVVLTAVLVAYGNGLEGFSFQSLRQDLQDSMQNLKRAYQASKDYVQYQVLNPFDTKVMVFNISESYVVMIQNVIINPGSAQWVPAKRSGGSFTITAKNKASGSPVSQSVLYNRLSTEDVLEVDVGRAPAFPQIVDRQTGRPLVAKQSWTTGTMSATVKIWTRALSLVQAQNGYNVRY